jgi:hypothetical protein
VVEPREDLLRRTLKVADLTEDDRERIRQHCFEELLVKSEAPAFETNAIEQELIDFAGAIREGREPRVTGADGRDAVAVAEQVLERVHEHRWDGADGVRQGPLAMPVLPLRRQPAAESWATDETVVLRKAG